MSRMVLLRMKASSSCMYVMIRDGADGRPPLGDHAERADPGPSVGQEFAIDDADARCISAAHRSPAARRNHQLNVSAISRQRASIVGGETLAVSG